MKQREFVVRTIRFDKVNIDIIEGIAKERDMSLAEFVRQAIESYLKSEDENKQLRAILHDEIAMIHKGMKKHTEMLYASVSGSAMLSAMILNREPGETEISFNSRKHSRVDRTIVDAMELGKWLVDGYHKLKNETPAKR